METMEDEKVAKEIDINEIKRKVKRFIWEHEYEIFVSSIAAITVALFIRGYKKDHISVNAANALTKISFDEVGGDFRDPSGGYYVMEFIKT